MFLVNSRLGHFSASVLRRSPFSRSYRTNLPSSLAVDHSSALVYSTQLRVSVYGTSCISRFSWKGLLDFALPEGSAQRAIPSAPSHLNPPSLLLICRCRNINLLSIDYPFRVCLRSRLTLIRLALIRNPWSFGEEVSHPLYRYLCLHLLFQKLHNTSRYCFSAVGMLPYQMYITVQIHSFGSMLMPDYYPCPVARLVSCYALFK